MARQRRVPPADNVSVSLRLPKKQVEILVGISTSTGLTVGTLCQQAVDLFLHNRGAYAPYEPAPTITYALSALALPEADDDGD